jgi:hypothetical protein
MELGKASEVLEFDESLMSLRIKSGVKLKGEGTYSLNVNLIDSKLSLSSKSFTVQYLCQENV